MGIKTKVPASIEEAGICFTSTNWSLLENLSLEIAFKNLGY